MALLIKRRPIRFRGPDIDVALPHEPLVADMQVVAVDLTFDAKADPILGLLAIGNVGANFAGLDAKCFGDRVLELRFRRRRQAEEMLLGHAAFVTDHVEHGRRAVGQGAGLVENHGVDFGEALHVRAALDDDAGARRMRHRGEHGGRRGDADAGAVIDDHQ